MSTSPPRREGGLTLFLLCALLVLCLSPNPCLAQDATSPISGLKINRPASLAKQYREGMLHSMALFGVPHYGKKLGPVKIYDATNNSESDGCAGWTADPAWSKHGPFIVLVNRGKCHFTKKVAYAQGQGAAAVIIRDNVLLSGEPASYCPNYEKPTYVKDGQTRPCLVGINVDTCKCSESGNVKPTVLPSIPACTGAANNNAVYETDKAKCGREPAPCWRCSASNDVFPLECRNSATRQCVVENREPFMADDGTGGSISIPSFIVSDYDGENLRNAIHASGTFVTMAWDLPQRSSVSYEMWTSSEDHNGAEFKRDFQELAVELRESTTFKPRYFIYDGIYQDCYQNVDCGSLDCKVCKDLCILDGRYCGPDPDNTFDGVKGADIVKENLRQMCIFKVLSKSTDAVQRKKDQGKWWCYANAFANNCYGEDGKMDSSETFAQCAVDQMQDVGIDVAAVNTCMSDAGGTECRATGTCQQNTMLEGEVLDRANFGILSLPSIVVNGVLLRTASTSGGAAELTVVEAICNAFAAGFAPDVCERIADPMGTSGSAGIATIEFNAELSYDGEYKYVPEIGTRFRDTLSMKLGVDRSAIRLEKTADKGGHTVLAVSLTRLMCTDERDETETVAQMLNKVNSCQEAVVDADDADKELESLENKAFYFHTHIPTDKKTHVVTAKMTGVKKNCLAHSGTKGTNVPTNGSGVSWPALIVILVILIALGAAGGFVWYQRVRNDMRHRVQSILEQYQPLEEISGKDESETAAML